MMKTFVRSCQLAQARSSTALNQTSMRSFAAAVAKQQKDYYKILGIQSFATPEEVKAAYRTMAKKHHPDVRATDSADHKPDIDLFRDIVEAYQVLSVPESRAAFDLTRKKNPQLFSESTEFDEGLMTGRDKRGFPERAKPARGSYAEQRMAELKAEREKYNVNDIGYYNGGVPREHRGSIRGEGTGYTGDFHPPKVHNFLNFYHQDTKRVTSEDALYFKHFMGSDKVDFLMSKPAHPMHYDGDFNFMKERDFWLKMLLAMMAGTYVYRRMFVEKDRARMTERMNGYADQPAHHFNNRGGVVVKKRFVGFQKYFQSSDEMMKWYAKVYPSHFN